MIPPPNPELPDGAGAPKTGGFGVATELDAGIVPNEKAGVGALAAGDAVVGAVPKEKEAGAGAGFGAFPNERVGGADTGIAPKLAPGLGAVAFCTGGNG